VLYHIIKTQKRKKNFDIIIWLDNQSNKEYNQITKFFCHKCLSKSYNPSKGCDWLFVLKALMTSYEIIYKPTADSVTRYVKKSLAFVSKISNLTSLLCGDTECFSPSKAGLSRSLTAKEILWIQHSCLKL
jgi:hypothetical protein